MAKLWFLYFFVYQQFKCSLLKEAISRGKVITVGESHHCHCHCHHHCVHHHLYRHHNCTSPVGIMAVNIRKSMQKKSIAALLYTFDASFPDQEQFGDHHHNGGGWMCYHDNAKLDCQNKIIGTLFDTSGSLSIVNDAITKCYNNDNLHFDYFANYQYPSRVPQ